MQAKPTISICIPTYNGSEYIEECLDSVLEQSYEKFEVLIVDDCSNDNTLEIANTYAEKDSRIRVVKNEKNLGLVGNWNKCIQLAQGEWIKFVFQDDLIESQCLEKMIAVADNDHPFIICRRDFVFNDVSGEVIQIYQKFLTELSMDEVFDGKTDISANDIINAQLRMVGRSFHRNFFGEPTSTLLHRDLFKKFGLFNPALIQKCDLEYWLRIGVNVGIRYIPETLAHFRVHSGATTAKNKSGRTFRAEELDDLVIWNEHFVNSSYTPLKSVISKYQQPFTRKSLAQKLFWHYKHAKAIANHSKEPDPTLLEEWEGLASTYPDLTKSFDFRLLQLQDRLDSSFLWRFHKK